MADNTASGGDLDKIREAIKLLPGSAFPVYEAVTQLQDEPAKHEAVKVYDGLTKEQWERVIDGGYLCDFWTYTDIPPAIGRLVGVCEQGFAADHRGDPDDSEKFKRCRPLQEYGIITPHFGDNEDAPEWVAHNAAIVYFKTRDGDRHYENFRPSEVPWYFVSEFIAIKP